VVIENVDSKPQTDYYIPFDLETIGKVGGLEVRDKKDSSKPAFKVEISELGPDR
jgi:oligosaccharyltransferase complex subunit alpha (ribophorin I)